MHKQWLNCSKKHPIKSYNPSLYLSLTKNTSNLSLKSTNFTIESSIKKKLNVLKRQVNRGFIETMKRVAKTKEDLEVEESEEIQEKRKPKAENCKIPATSTVVLEK